MPTALKACARLIRISEYRGGPQTACAGPQISDKRAGGTRLTSQIRVGRCLQGSQTVTDHEDGSAESPERLVQQAWPSDQGAEAIQTKSPDEDGLVSEMTEDPVCMAERCQWICPYTGDSAQ